MPIRLVAANEWCSSIMTEHQLRDLEKEGLLHPLTSLTRSEWIVPPAEHREPRPLEGYVVSFAKLHRHGLGSPLSHFMWSLCHHYSIELQHFSPNAIFAMVIFAAVCEGYLGVMPHWDLWLHLNQGELFPCSWQGCWGEEAGANRLPQPGLEDRPHERASSVHPHWADVQSCPVGLLVVLSPQ